MKNNNPNQTALEISDQLEQSELLAQSSTLDTLEKFKEKVKIYKLTDNYKESDNKAIETVKKHLGNRKTDEIEKISTKHEFRGIWEIKFTREVNFEFKEKKELFISEYNLNKISSIKIKDYPDKSFNVVNNMVQIEVIEQGNEYYGKEYLFESLPRASDIDKKLKKYLENQNKNSKDVQKRVDKWLSEKDFSLEKIKEVMNIQEIWEWLKNEIYAKKYDDKNDDKYSIKSDLLELDIFLYLIPIIRVQYTIKGNEQNIDVDAITREIMKSPSPYYISKESKEKLTEIASIVIENITPQPLGTAAKNVFKEGVKRVGSLLKKS